MKIYGLIVNGGDGSAGIQWVHTKEEADALLDDNHDPEAYSMNEGGPAVELTLPDGSDLAAIGIHFWE